MPASASPVAGLVLAAGASTRLGRDKLLVELDGEPLVRRAARIAVEAGLDPVLVVLAPGAAGPRAALDGLGCTIAVNPDPARGQGSSLAEGAAALPAGAGAVVVLLADMPRVSAAMVQTLVARWRQTGAPLVLSDYEGVTAPPALYDRRLFGALRAATAERAGKALAEAHRAEAAVVGWPASALADVDEPRDLRALDG